MKILYALIALSLVALPVFATDPPVPSRPPIKLPDGPPPPPPPPPPPGLPVRLGVDQLYVFEYDAPCVVLWSPARCMKKSVDSGPIKIRGKFADGTGNETRTYKGKFVYTLEAVETGRCELFVYPVGTTDEKDVQRRLIDCLVAPLPPPTPIPPPGPGPSPAPIPGDGLRVLMVYNADDFAAYSTVLNDPAIRAYLAQKCPAGADGKTAEFRCVDKTFTFANDEKIWQDAIKRPRTSDFWVVISNGKAGFEGALPKTPAECLTLLKQFGG